ncbi:uncharacterized protein FA14DRAFT_170767 [Meira miltonrushii]|uniref:Inositol-pentakisphosphate 2-kinase n=1 Tax=Meira miltonrushii TaxID=1280837 RepID=A0A316VKG6_9BASI|nr:uncharacterized protein FA14DRAFT_170767 [Meira miltonrushii]PWN38020.1 hypothetical protein FA14DRAFT_170767 [Meira miltonrushii]
MPPTPFHPTHTTPFKSSISSSQQAKRREALQSTNPTSTQGDSWPIPVNADQLDARHWTYLAEGGKNLLLRYTGPDVYPFVNTRDGRRMALRIGKSSRQQLNDKGASISSEPSSSSSNIQQKGGDEQEIDSEEWQERILLPDLADAGSDELVPPLIRVESTKALNSFLRFIISKIEGLRPIERRLKTGIDADKPSEVFITEDLSAPIPNHPCLILEIKPKCGFLPKEGDAWKQSTSRFRMHSVLKGDAKLTKEEFEALYDPLDLYSGQPDRVEKAATALYASWQQGRENNLRIFLDGKKVEHPTSVIEGGAGIMEQAETLTKKLYNDPNLNLAQAVARILASEQVQTILKRLRTLQQRYDPIDVEGVDKEAQRQEGKSLLDRTDEMSISLAEYESMLAKVGSGEKNLSLRELIASFLLSTSYKDCSLFIRISDGPNEPVIHTHLVDLDPKPVVKLPYLLSIDREITKTFTEWAKDVQL